MAKTGSCLFMKQVCNAGGKAQTAEGRNQRSAFVKSPGIISMKLVVAVPPVKLATRIPCETFETCGVSR